MKRNRTILLTILAAFVGFGLWAFAFEPASLTSKKHALSIPHWNPELDGLRIAVLTDLHVGSPYSGLAKLEKIVALTNSLKPDLVVLPGDFVIQNVVGGRFVAPEDAAVMLAKLKAPCGVWASLGNHDYWLDAPRVAAALQKQNIGVLQDKAVRIQKGGAHFWLLGISDFEEGPHDVAKAMSEVNSDAPIVLFTHNPDIFPMLSSRVSLVIAGHTHGGQVYLPLIGRPMIPSRYGQRFAYGHVIEGGRHIFISSGLGTSIFPVRFRVPPEVTLLELHAE